MEDDAKDDMEEESWSIENSSYSRLRIFEEYGKDLIPSDFDAVTISVDGGVHADLAWKKAREQAQRAIEEGYALMWDIQLGLFKDLGQPIVNQGQFLSLALSLEHFRDSLWNEFKSQTVGVSLYRGSADFSIDFPWDHHQEQNLKEWIQGICLPDMSSLDLFQLRQHIEGQQFIRIFCLNVAVEYLSLLATRLPDSLSTFLYLDVSSLKGSLVHEVQLLNPERFERFHLALRGHRLPFEAWGWGGPTTHGYSGYTSVELPALQEVSVGVCVPSESCYPQQYDGLEEGFRALRELAIPFKLIAESQLTSQWDGLDYLLYTPSGLSVQGKRKLQGFCAAGGTVVSTGNLLGLPYEVSLKNWAI